MSQGKEIEKKYWITFSTSYLRLSAEMESLRRVYEEQTDKAKSEYMNLHSQKVILKNSPLTI